MPTMEMLRKVMRLTLALFYAGAGIVHLFLTEAFLPIVPGWVPFPWETVIVTGVFEVAGSIGLVIKRYRKWAGAMLALYAVCVFPANLKHAIDFIDLPPIPNSWWYHAPRLAMQPVLVWWALFCAGVIDWPAKKRHEIQR